MNQDAHPIQSAAFRSFLEAAALWRFAEADATEVMEAAVIALVAGTESPSFILIAGLTPAEAGTELSELLPHALHELGVTCLAAGDPENDILAAAVLSNRFLRGEIEAEAMTAVAHRAFGHLCHANVEELSRIDHCFDTLCYSSTSREELIARTHSAASVLQEEARAIYARSVRSA